MDTFVLYHPLTRPSGRALAAALDSPGGVSLRGYDPDVIVRWGSRRALASSPRRVLNKAAAIGRASDKLATFELLSDAGVPVPLFGDHSDALVWASDGATVLGRTRRQSRGRGITVYAPGETVASGHELYTRLVEDVRNEYRLHVVGTEVVRVQRKLGPGDAAIRSHGAGFRYVGLVSRRLHSDRLTAATEAVRALALDFGAVDLLVTRAGEPFVLEVNSAPAMSPLTVSVYAAALARLGREG